MKVPQPQHWEPYHLGKAQRAKEPGKSANSEVNRRGGRSPAARPGTPAPRPAHTRSGRLNAHARHPPHGHLRPGSRARPRTRCVCAQHTGPGRDARPLRVCRVSDRERVLSVGAPTYCPRRPCTCVCSAQRGVRTSGQGKSGIVGSGAQESTRPGKVLGREPPTPQQGLPSPWLCPAPLPVGPDRRTQY